MAKIKNFNELLKICPYYIHSFRTFKTDGKQSRDPALRKMTFIDTARNSKENVLKRQTSARIERILTFDGRKLDLAVPSDEKILQDYNDMLTKGFQQAVSNKRNKQLITDVNYLVNSKTYLSDKAANGWRKFNDQAKKGLQDRLDAMARIFNTISNLEKNENGIEIFYLALYRYVPSNSEGINKLFIQSKKIAETYVKTHRKLMNKKVLEDSINKANAFIKQMITMTEIKGVKDTNSSIFAHYTSFIGKEIGEPAVELMTNFLVLEDGVKLVDKELLSTGKMVGKDITIMPTFKEGLDKNLQAPVVRADSMYKGLETHFSIDGRERTIKANVGLNTKWYQTEKSGLLKTWLTNNKGEKVEDRSVFILSQAPILRFINEVAAGSYNDARKYINAYFVPLDNKDLYPAAQSNQEVIEKLAVISGLMGSGYNIEKHEDLTDVNLFFIVNGKVYSIINLLNDILKANDWRQKIKISYEGVGSGYHRSMAHLNKWAPPDNRRNLTSASKRSQETFRKFRDIKISASINAKFLNQYGTKPIATL